MGINKIQEVKVDELWWQKQGLTFTASGYGSKIPTIYKIKVDNKWYRVYQCIFSNTGTFYINRKSKDKNYLLENVVCLEDILELL